MKIFIGSSKEQILVAEEIAGWLENWNHQPILWSNHVVFPLGNYTLESLTNIGNEVDAAIFIFGADDKTWFRNQSILSVRDNVLLEYGLFVGKLSRKNVVILTKGDPHIPSDLLGLTNADIDKPYTTKPVLKQWIDDLYLQKKDTEVLAPLMKGEFQVTDLYTAFQIALHGKKSVDNFRVFAISTFKSVQMLRLMSDLRIKNAYILLRKYIENDHFYEETMQHSITTAVKNWQTMVKKNNISNLHLSFFNYHPDEGFYIIDDRYLITGILNYDANTCQSEFTNEVILIDNRSDAGKKWIQCYIERFNITYENYRTEEI